MRFSRVSVAIVAFAFACVIAAGVADWWNDRDLRQARLEFCEQVEAIRTYARDTATRSLESLPTIGYYREHPSELDQALANVRRQREAFIPPLDCEAFADGQPPLPQTKEEK